MKFGTCTVCNSEISVLEICDVKWNLCMVCDSDISGVVDKHNEFLKSFPPSDDTLPKVKDLKDSVVNEKE